MVKYFSPEGKFTALQAPLGLKFNNCKRISALVFWQASCIKRGIQPQILREVLYEKDRS